MTIQLVSKGIYRFVFGSNVYTIKAENVVQAKDELLKDLDKQMNCQIIAILDKESLD